MKFVLLLLFTLSHAYAAPSNDTKEITILNQCGHALQVGIQTNDKARGDIIQLNASDRHRLPVKTNWAGRIWARESCDVHDCGLAGASNPASLAEFKMASDLDYYDVSFVDGYNFPISIEPIHPNDKIVKTDDKHCRKSTCTQLPTCPKDLRASNKAGKFVACESACSKYGSDQYCCTGEHNTAETCTSNHYAKQVKNMCPDSYSYAFDDATSVYGCKALSYQVVFCP